MNGIHEKHRKSYISFAGRSALFFIDHPELRPEGCPDPQQDAAGFAGWVDDNAEKVEQISLRAWMAQKEPDVV